MFLVYFPLAHMVWGIDGFMKGIWNAKASIKAIEASKCNDHFGVWCALASAYAVCDVSFALVAQQGWGTAGTFDKTKLIQFFVSINKDDGSSSVSWDIWIDDVQFYQ
jgi:hypothetical protein